MHESVLEFVRKLLKPEHVKGQRVLEVGSLNVNGSVRPIVEAMGPDRYVGVDVVGGPGVDIIDSVEEHVYAHRSPDIGDHRIGDYDLVISCEMLEHAEDWSAALQAMKDALRPGGWLLLTARSPGFHFHNPPDRWRFTEAWARLAFADMEAAAESDPQVPGVFVFAQKYSLDGIEAERMEQP